MSSSYEPKNHIQRLEVAPDSESVLDQREITVQTYKTNLPFNYDALDKGLESAWLNPQIRFGVFARSPASDKKDELHVVLGLQDDMTVRAYDYDNRRPLWFSWKNLVVDTVAIRYFKTEDGFLHFTTTGGGRRITDEKLHEFNSTFLGIPKDAATKLQFDLEKLRALCFDRFVERLYMVKFGDAAAEEYRSIDHTQFKSREYIDPTAGRLKEIRDDSQVKIESFDSDLVMRSSDIAAQIQVRFFIRGTNGSLRLRFPKITYRTQHKTVEDQVRVFYRLVDDTVGSILDSDYYARQQMSLEELEKNCGFPEMADTTPFREVLSTRENREQFFATLDLNESKNTWLPHLRAVNELLGSKEVEDHVRTIIKDLGQRDPGQAVQLVAFCQQDAQMARLGGMVALWLADEIQTIPSEQRAPAEARLLSWAIDHEESTWDIDVASGEFGALNLRWGIDDIAFEALPVVLWKLTGILHARIMENGGDTAALLEKFNWCMAVARELPPNQAGSPAAIRLVAADKVPASMADARMVLKDPVTDLRALDDATLNQFGLPLWPWLSATRSDKKVVVTNSGVGAALAVAVYAKGLDGDRAPAPVDVLQGASVALSFDADASTIDLSFEKLGRQHCVTLPVIGAAPATTEEVPDNIRALPAVINRKRAQAQREYRQEIDPGGVVVGSSPVLLKAFEEIYYANKMDDPAAVIIVGERGTGKTHLAKLIHSASGRASQALKEVNAGGAGGDLNIQRGEWVGYGKNHGIQGIDRNGRSGHLIHASRGTIFVDEFVELSPDLQVIFLSVLEGRPIEKVGGESVTPDVRCVFATNADVDAAIAQGKLRADLVDRIQVTVQVPPLRDRKGDILLLAKHFAGQHNVAERCLVALLHQDWPGNIRELKNKVNQALARKNGDGATALDLSHFDLPADIIKVVSQKDDDACRRELWTLADEIARDEGFEHGGGLQKRAGEIMGVGEAQASKMYRAFGLGNAPAANAAAAR